MTDHVELWEQERLKYERREDARKELEYVRAFVGRVEKRWKADDNPFSVLRHMRDELATMEKANVGTND